MQILNTSSLNNIYLYIWSWWIDNGHRRPQLGDAVGSHSRYDEILINIFPQMKILNPPLPPLELDQILLQSKWGTWARKSRWSRWSWISEVRHTVGLISIKGIHNYANRGSHMFDLGDLGPVPSGAHRGAPTEVASSASCWFSNQTQKSRKIKTLNISCSFPSSPFLRLNGRLTDSFLPSLLFFNLSISRFRCKRQRSDGYL